MTLKALWEKIYIYILFIFYCDWSCFWYLLIHRCRILLCLMSKKFIFGRNEALRGRVCSSLLFKVQISSSLLVTQRMTFGLVLCSWAFVDSWKRKHEETKMFSQLSKNSDFSRGSGLWANLTIHWVQSMCLNHFTLI